MDRFPRPLVWVLFAGLTFLTPLGTLALHAGDQPVYTSDFERNLNDWTGREGFGNSKPKLSVGTDGAKEEGKPYCVVETDGKLGCGFILKPIVHTEEGKEYILSFWFKSDKVLPVTYHLTDDHNGNGEASGVWHGIRKSEGEWVRVEYSFVATSNNIGFEIGVGAKEYTPAKLYIYDCRITPN